MKKYLISLFISINICSFSQDHKVSILLSPLCLIDDLSFPTIQGGIEIKISDRITSYNEFGIKYREGYFEPIDTSFIQSSGYKVKSEIRYYLKRKDNKKNTHQRGLYLGANAFFIRDTHNGEIDYFNNGDTTIESSDYFAVKKNAWGLNAIMGWHQLFKKHIILETFWGLGIRIRMTENYNREYDPTIDEIVRTTDITAYGIKSAIDAKEGTKCLLNITGGVRIGYRF